MPPKAVPLKALISKAIGIVFPKGRKQKLDATTVTGHIKTSHCDVISMTPDCPLTTLTSGSLAGGFTFAACPSRFSADKDAKWLREAAVQKPCGLLRVGLRC